MKGVKVGLDETSNIVAQCLNIVQVHGVARQIMDLKPERGMQKNQSPVEYITEATIEG